MTKGIRHLPHHHFTPVEIEIIRKRYPVDPVADIAEQLGLDVRQIYGLAKRLGIRKHEPQPRYEWTEEQIAIVRAQYADTRSDIIAEQVGAPLEKVYRLAKKLRLSKSAAFLSSEHGGRLRGGGNHVGKAFQFKPGQVPKNKGIKGWQAGGRSVETQFKKGHKTNTWRPIGTDRLSKEGYVQVKLTDTGVTRHDYICVHHLVWELHRGAIPDGFRVTFKDRNKANIVIDNLELVSIADMMRRNTLHNYPKEIAHAIQLRAAINRRINKRLERDDDRNQQH